MKSNACTKLDVKSGLRLDFTSNYVHGLAFGTPKIYIAPYGKVNHRLANVSSNCDVKLYLSVTLFLIKLILTCSLSHIQEKKAQETYTEHIYDLLGFFYHIVKAPPAVKNVSFHPVEQHQFTLELQWLEHLWYHENVFETGVVRAMEFIFV